MTPADHASAGVRLFIEQGNEPGGAKVVINCLKSRKTGQAQSTQSRDERGDCVKNTDPAGFDASLPVETRPLLLADILDVRSIQAMMDAFFELTQIGVGIVDMQGNVLVATGWQDICTKFHRVHPETCKNCIENDTLLYDGIPPGTYKKQRCRNGMWDIATPIVVDGKQLGNLFLGQFLFDDEVPDYEVFRANARKYGFDETEYLAVLDRVPRWSRETVDRAMAFYIEFAKLVSVLSFRSASLARTVAVQEQMEESLQKAKLELEQRVAERTQDLLAANEELTAMNAEVGSLNQMLAVMNAGLEQRVSERTAELEAAYAELSAQYGAFRKTQAILQESEMNYGNLVRNLTDGVVLRDETGQIIYSNQAFADMVQIDDPSILTGIPYLHFVHPADREGTVDRVAKVIRGIPVAWREHRLVGLQGRTILVSSTGVPVEHGGKPCVLGILHDVTERKTAETKLLRGARIQAVLGKIAGAAALSSSMDELYRTVHNFVGQVLPAKLFNINLLDEMAREIVVPYSSEGMDFIPARRPVGKGLTEYVMRLGRTVHLTPDDMVQLEETGEYTLGRDQNVKPRYYLGAPLIDSRGKAFGVMALTQLDLTQAFQPEDVELISIIAAQVSMAIERKRAEEALIDSEARYRTLMEQSPDVVLLCDPDTGTILEANSRFAERLGYELQLHSPMKLADLITNSKDPLRMFLSRKSITGYAQARRHLLRHRNGSLVDVEGFATLIHYRGRNLFVLTLRDVSEEVRREREIHRDAQMATRVQKALLSSPEPSEHLDITFLYKPYAYVGGDLYFTDWRHRGQVFRGFLADATGHGLGTALHTASMHVLLREVNGLDLPLSEAMRWLNRRTLEYFGEGIFAGALGFELDLSTRELRWSCAGIPRFWMMSAAQQGAVDCPGMCLGIMEAETFELHTIPIGVEDAFYFMTDGLADLLATATEPPLGNYPQMVELLRKLSESADRRDDATAVCIRVRSLPKESARRSGWPRTLYFDGYSDYQRYRGEVTKILAELTGLPHSPQEVAVNEALANAMECRDGKSRQHKARLRFNKVGGWLVVRVRTSRIGFAGNAILRRLRSHPEDMFSFGEDAAMGRGIPMMLSISQRITYNSEGTEVLLAWKL